jgi:enoyl-CoA hydratase/carnithine racemase
LGGGVEWLARFDFRWCTPNVYFNFWQRRIGLSTGWGGGRAWAKKIGGERVKSLLLESDLIGAAQAEQLGLVDRLVSSWNIRDHAAEWAARMDTPAAHGLLKWDSSREARLFQSLWMGPEHRAVLSKWKG